MKKCFIFIDEAGSPDFFGKKKKPLWTEGDFVPYCLVGAIKTWNRTGLRKNVVKLQNEILADTLYNQIPSVAQPGWYFHGSQDHPEIRAKFFEFLRRFDHFECNVVIGRKIPEIFMNKHNGKAEEFYFDLISKLFHFVELEEEIYSQLYLASRQSNNEQRFVEAVEKSIEIRRQKAGLTVSGLKYKCDVVKSAEYPEMSVVDYMLWAVQRYITKGEKRFFLTVEHKYTAILDAFDPGENNVYTAENPFDLLKAPPFK